jgi:iron(III) transport system permease protein
MAGSTEQPTVADEPEESSGLAAWGLYPVAAAVAVLVLLPLSWLAIATARVGPTGAADLLARPRTLQVVVNSVLMTTLVTGLSLLIGVPLAYLTVRTDLPGRRLWTVALSLPLVIPSYIGAFAFVSAFAPKGEVQSVLSPLGIDAIPGLYGLGGATVVITLYTYPYVFITTRAALKSMDTTLVEAARTLRHTRLQAFRRVTLPQIKPAVTAGALLVALYALSDFGTPAILRYDVFTREIYTEFTSFGGGRNSAAMLSLVLVALTLVILAIERRASDDGVSTSRGHTGVRNNRVSLGRWRWVAVLPCALVSGVALVVPLSILTLWLVRGKQLSTGLTFQLGFVWNSVGIAAVAALVAALVGLPIAHLSARDDSLPAQLFERASYVGYAVPGIVLGLAIVFLGARFGGDFYQSGLLAFPLLVFAYVVRFLPQAVGSTRASILRVSPSLPEAARSLGKSRLAAFRSVTFPLIAPGQIGGAALVFLTVMKELPATLMLKPSGFETLVTFIWRAERATAYGRAAVPALILLVVSSLSMLVLLSMEGYHVE